MDKQDIIKLADHQGLIDYFDLDGDSVGELMLCTLVRDCIAAEREACAKVASSSIFPDASNYPSQIAEAIRARGESK